MSSFRRDLVAFIATCVLTSALCGFAYWLIGLHLSGWKQAADSTSILQAYTEGLASGQASLPIKPDPRLLKLPNPYDPDENQGYRVLDASLFEGKYYCYFGVVPFLFIFVPWLKMTGGHLSATAAIWLCSVLGLVAYNFAIWIIWRTWCRGKELGLLVLALLTVSCGSAIWLVLVQIQIHSVLSAAGYAMFGVAILCLCVSEVRSLFVAFDGRLRR